MDIPDGERRFSKETRTRFTQLTHGSQVQGVQHSDLTSTRHEMVTTVSLANSITSHRRDSKEREAMFLVMRTPNSSHSSAQQC